jgi:hypothetical protein
VIWWPASGGRVLCEGPIAPWPASLDQVLAEAEQRKAEARRVPLVLSPTKLNGPLVPSGIAGDRQELPQKLYFKMLALMRSAGSRNQRRARELLKVVVQKSEGEQNDGLNWAAFRFRELIDAGAITRENAESLLFEAASLNGYIDRDGLRDAAKTIHSGLGP